MPPRWAMGESTGNLSSTGPIISGVSSPKISPHPAKTLAESYQLASEGRGCRLGAIAAHRGLWAPHPDSPRLAVPQLQDFANVTPHLNADGVRETVAHAAARGLEPYVTSGGSQPVRRMPRPGERIKGVFKPD